MLFIVREPNIMPLVYGGSEQEFGLRGGTENVPGIVGLGAAAEIAVANMQEDTIMVSMAKQKFYMELLHGSCLYLSSRRQILP